MGHMPQVIGIFVQTMPSRMWRNVEGPGLKNAAQNSSKQQYHGAEEGHHARGGARGQK